MFQEFSADFPIDYAPHDWDEFRDEGLDELPISPLGCMNCGIYIGERYSYCSERCRIAFGDCFAWEKDQQDEESAMDKRSDSADS